MIHADRSAFAVMGHRGGSGRPEDDADGSVDGLVRRRGLRFRCVLHDHRHAASGRGERDDHHQAIVWHPKTRVAGTGWSNRSSADALKAALDSYLVAATCTASPVPRTLGTD